jgi:hypothetical protein
MKLLVGESVPRREQLALAFEVNRRHGVSIKVGEFGLTDSPIRHVSQ